MLYSMKYLYIAYLILLTAPTWADTGDSTRVIKYTDSVEISIDDEDRVYMYHVFERGQTLYSISKHYGLSVNELLYNNPGVPKVGTKYGTRLRIPIPRPLITRYQKENFVRWKYAPVFYKVKRGESLWRIAKVRMRMEVDDVKALNGLTSNYVRPGTLLHVGWLSTRGVPDKLKPDDHLPEPISRYNKAYKKKFYQQAKTQKPRSQRGPLVWNKMEQSPINGLMVLHRYAEIGSVVQLRNNTTGRRVFAKVSGRLPDNGRYAKEVVAVVAPDVAKALGVRDPKFYVELQYFGR